MCPKKHVQNPGQIENLAAITIQKNDFHRTVANGEHIKHQRAETRSQKNCITHTWTIACLQNPKNRKVEGYAIKFSFSNNIGYSCTIITTSQKETVRPISDRPAHFQHCNGPLPPRHNIDRSQNTWTQTTIHSHHERLYIDTRHQNESSCKAKFILRSKNGSSGLPQCIRIYRHHSSPSASFHAGCESTCRDFCRHYSSFGENPLFCTSAYSP